MQSWLLFQSKLGKSVSRGQRMNKSTFRKGRTFEISKRISRSALISNLKVQFPTEQLPIARTTENQERRENQKLTSPLLIAGEKIDSIHSTWRQWAFNGDDTIRFLFYFTSFLFVFIFNPCRWYEHHRVNLESVPLFGEQARRTSARTLDKRKTRSKCCTFCYR